MLDPNNPTTADSAVIIGVIVVVLTLIWIVYDSRSNTKRKKEFNEQDLFK